MVGKRAKFEKNKADERRPQELREEDIARSENETTKHVIDVSTTPLSLRYFLSANTSAFFFFSFQLRKLLMDQNGPVNLFRFFINPSDFAQSVENLFYLSFLIRDGECALEMEDGEPVICASYTRSSRALASGCNLLINIMSSRHRHASR